MVCSLSLLRFFSCGFSRAFQGHLKPPAPVLAYFFRDVKCFHFSQTDGSHQKLVFSTSLLVKEAQWMQSFRTGPFYLTTWTETQLLTLLSDSRSWLSDRTSPKSISQAPSWCGDSSRRYLWVSSVQSNRTAVMETELQCLAVALPC